jgi:hypothetical protein
MYDYDQRFTTQVAQDRRVALEASADRRRLLTRLRRAPKG